MWPVKLSFAAVTSRGDNHGQSGLLTDAACNLHISVGVEPAYHSRAPIAAHAYHLRAAAVAPLRERVKRMERKERKHKNERLRQRLICVVSQHIHACIFLSYSF